MKVKHLLLIPVLIYLIYLDIYTIMHFELLNKNKNTAFEMLAGISFIASCGIFGVLIIYIINAKIKQIDNFLNKKIL